MAFHRSSPERCLFTPSPKWNTLFFPPLPSTSTPLSEIKRTWPANKDDHLFHVIHKVPSGDSPYVKAKHVQLVDKDPGKAISMFWGSCGECIEGHGISYDSQESFDNILVELYKFDALVAALPISEGGEEAQLKRIAELQAENDVIGQELQKQLEAAEKELNQVQELYRQASDNCLNLKKPD